MSTSLSVDQLLAIGSSLSGDTPRWMADGSILFVSSLSGEPDIWTIRPDGSGLRRLTSGMGGVGHLACGRYRCRQHPIVTLGQRSRRERRAGRLVQFQEIDDVLDYLGEDEPAALGHHRYAARTQRPQLFEAAILQHVDRFKGDPTDRQKFLHAKAGGSMRLPEDLNLLAHQASFLSIAEPIWQHGSATVNDSAGR